MSRPAHAVALLALALPSSVWAAPGAGTVADPVVIDMLPYVVAGNTSGAPSSVIDRYDCASGLDESGPERIYRFSLAAPARVTAWVEGDGGAVDIDVHLLAGLTLDGATATGCLARGNVIAEAQMSAGEHYVVVDSFEGAAQAGAFVLHVDAIGDAWVERPIADGVTWRARRFGDQNGPQVVHELVVDTLAPGVELRALDATGCQTVDALGRGAGALAGVNGGYFTSGCAPVSLLKQGGALVAANAVTRGAFGVASSQAPLVEVVAAGQDWPAAAEAHGGGPVLVDAGVARQGSAAWSAEGFDAGFQGKHPRTFAGYDADGRSHLVTVDGRRGNAAGMSLNELAGFAAGAEIGLDEAVNLDGGGSTTMWIRGATPNGVVNYPSDATQEQASHPGARPCSGGMFVFAEPYNHPPRFQTEPPTQAAVGVTYAYDVDALDLDVTDTVTYSLASAPQGMAIDPDTGDISFAPEITAPPSAAVTVVAADDRGAQAEQNFTLTIAGGMGPPEPTGSGGGASSATAAVGTGSGTGSGGATAGAGGADAGGVPGGTEGGCSVGALPTGGAGAWLLALAALGLMGRPRFAARRGQCS